MARRRQEPQQAIEQEAPLSPEVLAQQQERQVVAFEEMGLGNMVEDLHDRLMEANIFLGDDAENFDEAIDTLEAIVNGLDPRNPLRQFASGPDVGDTPEDNSEYSGVKKVYGEEATRALYEEWRHSLREVLLVVDAALDTARSEGGEFEDEARIIRVLELVRNLTENSEDITLPPYLHTTFEDFARRSKFLSEGDIQEPLLGERQNTQESINHLIWSLDLYPEGSAPWQRSNTTEITLTPEEAATRQVAERDARENRNTEYYKKKRQDEIEVMKRTLREKGNPTVNTWGRKNDGSEPLEVQRRGFLGRRNERVDAPKTFFMQEQFVRTQVTKRGKTVERLVPVKVCVSGISEIRWRDSNLKYGESSTSNKPVRQDIYMYDTSANSVIKAQELLWTLEAAEETTTPDGKKYYKIPATVNKELQWVPYTAEEYTLWKRQLKMTVKNFEDAGLSYEKVKKQQDIKELAANLSPETITVESPVDSCEASLQEGWMYGHLQLIALEDSLENLQRNEALSAEQQTQLEAARTHIRTNYLRFLSAYGRNTDYEATALTQLIERGILGEGTLIASLTEDQRAQLEAEISAIVAIFENQRVQLMRFANQELEILSAFRENPDSLEEPNQVTILMGIRGRFDAVMEVTSADEEEASVEEDGVADDLTWFTEISDALEDFDFSPQEPVGEETPEPEVEITPTEGEIPPEEITTILPG